MSTVAQGFPVPSTPVVNDQGQLTPVWYQFLFNVWNRTGGSSASALQLSTPATIAGQIPVFSGTSWTPQVMTGDATLSSVGYITVTKSQGNPILSMAFQAATAVAITGGTIDGTVIGGTTPAAGSFTNLSASGTLSGVAFTNLFAAPPPIGSTTPNTGAFTSLSSTSLAVSTTISGSAFTTYFASPPAIGSTSANSGAFTTLSATSTVSGAGFTSLFASPPSIGSTTAGSGAFTTLSFSSLLSSGTAGYSDTGIASQFTQSVAGYYQSIWQNTSNNAAASTDIIVSNNLATATTYYGDFGINSSTFTGTGSLNLANATYLYSASGDLSIGTLTSNAIHFVVNNGATDALAISSAGVVSASNVSLTGGSINGTTVGATTASTGAFTTLSASSTVSGTGFSNYLASPPSIGNTAANSGAFTTLSASSTVSGTGFSNYMASPPSIGNTAANSGAFTTLSASSTVSGTGFTNYFSSPPAIGNTAANTGAFTTLSASSTVSGSGFTSYFASPPAIGSTSANTGAFTTLSASSTVSGTGFSNYFASPPALGSTTANTGAFTTLSASSTVSGTGFTNYFASPPAIGGTAANTGAFTTLTATGNISTSAGTISATVNVNSNAPIISLTNANAGTGVYNSFQASNGTSSVQFGVAGTGVSPYHGLVANGCYMYTTNTAGIQIVTDAAGPIQFWINASQVGGFTSTGLNSTAIGATTASTGAFTTLSATSTVSGAGFTSLFASPPAIGGTAAAAGTFTSVTSTSAGQNFISNSTTGGLAINSDTYLRRNAAANWALGAADAAAPVAQTISMQNVVAGTTNTNGASLTIQGGNSTGTGSGGSIIFQTGKAGLTGSSQNTMTTAVTIDASQNVTLAGTSLSFSSSTPVITIPRGGTYQLKDTGGNARTFGTVDSSSNLDIGDSNFNSVVISANSVTIMNASATGANLIGTNTNNNANSGTLGEYVSSTIASGSAVSLTTATTANVTSISLTAGDWDVFGQVSYTPAGTTTASAYSCGINTTSATLPTAPGAIFTLAGLSFTAGTAQNFGIVDTRLSISSTTTVYLVAQATFAVSTMKAYGFIGARRRR